MKRMLLALGILGLVGVAPVGAQTQVKIFGKTYNVVLEKRAQTYKKQGGGSVTITLPPRDTSLQLGSLNFVEGADPSQDRLFVGMNANADDETNSHQFYLMTGADANGVFTKDSATVTEYFGGSVTRQRGGRPTGHMWLNDTNTGVGVDRNIAISTYHDTDAYRLYDFDKMTGVAGDNADGLNSDAVFSLLLGEDTEENSPGASFTNYARFPQWDGHTVVVFAQRAGGTGVNVWDTKQDKMFPAQTQLQEVTASSTAPFPAEITQIYGVFHHSANGSWVMGSPEGVANPSDATTSMKIVRVQLTFPADLTKATPGSIKAAVLGISEELKGTPLHGKYGDEGVVYGMTKGREIAPGMFRLYFGDSEGNIATATPVP